MLCVVDIQSGHSQFNADPSPDLEEWGTLIVIFDSCTSGRLQMTGKDGTKRVDIVKLTGIGDLDCDT